ncbi:hypothetical protein ACWDRB_43570 [Nonomuraea sp. NPDC003707]
MILMVGNTSRLETPMQNSTGNRERLLDVVGGFARFCGGSWTDASSHLKRGVMLMWAAGIALVVLGVFGDVTKMWASFPFLTNLITSITAFFFAVPIALLFLQNVTRRQAERLERATASRMLNDSMSRLALQRVRNTAAKRLQVAQGALEKLLPGGDCTAEPRNKAGGRGDLLVQGSGCKGKRQPPFPQRQASRRGQAEPQRMGESA